ncbi:MAG: T9SS type A sorting domain-containing protein [Saprospiraceae bacterium]|nr:T9SS type A sorting domain-containing protein [Saprospiraceae bacterium]
MQKLLYLLLFMAVASPSFGQFRVLFVDDSGDAFGNAEYLASALDSLGYESVYIDAIGSATSPTAEQMSEFDLVIWHTSAWGLGLQLWNGTDADNAELIIYLSQPDANLWLIGNDFFYDRYGGAPVTFQTGDFAYEFLGISKYDVQSYVDDGGFGVPLAETAPGQPISGLTDINWQFSTLWYADGFELRPEAAPIYLFGDNSYSLSGKPTGVWYHPEGGARVLTYGFDLALANNFDLIKSNVDSVLTWWQGELSATQSPVFDAQSVQVAPNTFSDHLQVTVTALETAPLTVNIHGIDGRLITQLANGQVVRAGEAKTWQWQAPAGLPDGLYYCSVRSGKQVKTLKVVKM